MPSEPKLQAKTNTAQPLLRKLISPLLALAVGSVIVVLIAIFTLAGWAELSVAHHAVQHVLIFAGGVGFGGVVFGKLAKGGTR